MRPLRLFISVGVAVLWTGAAAADCLPIPEPVIRLSFDSRYAENDETRSELDQNRAEAAEAALEPVDRFLRELIDQANQALEGNAEAAACAVAGMADWARADALSDLGTETAQLTLGNRLAGFALALLQAAPLSGRDGDVAEVEDWLRRRLNEQLRYWEEEAPLGARQGNLRAWAALAAAAASARTGDPALQGWASWSTAYVLCTAAPDGSLPQEMRRGRLALHYQLHAVTPLAVTVLLLQRQGIDLAEHCGGAIHRVAGFVLDDLESGELTRAITGDQQSLFDGSDQLETFQLAWIEAYLRLPEVPRRVEFEALADRYGPFSYSKIGGDQALLWNSLP